MQVDKHGFANNPNGLSRESKRHPLGHQTYYASTAKEYYDPYVDFLSIMIKGRYAHTLVLHTTTLMTIKQMDFLLRDSIIFEKPSSQKVVNVLVYP